MEDEEHMKGEDLNVTPTKEDDPKGELIGDKDHDKESVEEARESKIV